MSKIQKLRPTKAEKRAIRAHWAMSYPHIRFRSDGTVEARRKIGDPWGVLYSVRDLQAHIKSLRT